MFRVFNVCVCVCLLLWEKNREFFLTHTLTPRDTTLLWVRWEEPSEVGLKVFSLLSSCCCLLLVVFFLLSCSCLLLLLLLLLLMMKRPDVIETCFVVYVSFFLTFPILVFSRFPVERECANLCVIRENSSSSVWCAPLFVISVSFEREYWFYRTLFTDALFLWWTNNKQMSPHEQRRKKEL